MENALDMMVKSLQGGNQTQPPPDQAMHPVGTPPNPQAQPNAMNGMGGLGILGGGNAGLLQMLSQSNGMPNMMNMFGKKDTDGNPQAAPDAASPGEFVPGGQSNPSSTSVTPF
jgi:hypothetical protein